MTTTLENTLPRWDLTPIFPALESAEFRQEFDSVVSEIGALVTLFDARQVRRRETLDVDAAFVAAYEEITGRINALNLRIRTLHSYIGCFVMTDARNEEAQARESLLDAQSVPLAQLMTRYIAWVGSSDVEALLKQSEVARNHAHAVRRAQKLAQHQMPEAEEALASELAPTAINAWARLHGNFTALLTATVWVDGVEKTLPMSSVRALSNHPDRATRKAAFEAEIQTWEGATVPLAAALNGVKGYQTILRRRRGYTDDVEPTLTTNAIDRATLDAMQQACSESFPDFRRYLKAKARALGLERLAWYDLNAPLGKTAKRYRWLEAEEFIRNNFQQYSERLADFADRTFRERWIDAEPRIGKEGGAYCTGIRSGESRILMNFDGSFNSVSTLAHELGHGYHNLNLQERTSLQRATPMTLAETASIFCETLAFEAALERANDEERLVLLDTSLQRDLGVVVDIHSRFLFEQEVFVRRAERDLTVAELNEAMTRAQHATYGEDIVPLHPLMWTVKGHYYGPTFYNYPYTFGLLFGVGLYAYYKQNPDTFRAQYDDFLASTGLEDARTLAQRFDIDITHVDFWRSSLDIIRKNINEFERLTS